MCYVKFPIYHFYICITISSLLFSLGLNMALHLRRIMESRNKVLQIPDICKIIKLTKPNIHIQCLLYVDPGQKASIHVPELLEVSLVMRMNYLLRIANKYHEGEFIPFSRGNRVVDQWNLELSPTIVILWWEIHTDFDMLSIFLYS